MQELEKHQETEKISKMYDASKTTKKLTIINNIKKFLKISQNVQNLIHLKKSAIENVKKENYLGAIRNLHNLKSKQTKSKLKYLPPHLLLQYYNYIFSS